MDENYKELIRLAPKYATQLLKTMEVLLEIQSQADDALKEELVLKYKKEKEITDQLSKRFHELIGLTKNTSE